MNQAHLHLLFNHLPIIVPMIGFLVMIGGLILNLEMVKRTAYCILILGAISAFPAAATGEGAEEIVEEIQGTDHHLIHEHEEKAETFALLSYILGAVAAFGLWASWKEKSYSKYIPFATLAFCAVVLFFAQQTGASGGEIRHTEISGKTVNQGGGEQHEEKDEH